MCLILGMVIAGLAEFILGNTYPFAVFIIYGAHWGSLAYTQDPIHNTTVRGLLCLRKTHGGNHTSKLC